MLISRGTVACLVVLTLVSSVDGLAGDKKKNKEEAAASHAVHWTYTGEEGPANWSHLNADYERCGSGKHFDLLQFHFHAPSEHAIDGKLAPAELHLVHKSADGELAVVGLLIHLGDANAALGPVFRKMPAKADGRATLAGTFDPAPLLPAVRTTYRYSGSLTTPPCSEGVRWNVVTAPIQVSEAQLAQFERLHKGSNRPLQPLHDRTLVLDSTP